jgi:hypothetical protein
MNLPGPYPLTLEDLARAIATRLGREGDAR